VSESPWGRWTVALPRCSTALVLAVCATACAGWMQAARAQSGTTFQDDLGLDGLLDSIFQGNDTVVLDEADLEAAVPYDQPEEAATPEAIAAQGQPEASPTPATPPAVAEAPPALPMPRPAAPAYLDLGDSDLAASEPPAADGADDPATGEEVAYADPAVAELILSVTGQEDAPAQANDGVASVRGSSGLTRLETSNSDAATFGATSASGSNGSSDVGTNAEETDTSALAFREDEWIPVPTDRPDNVPSAQTVRDVPDASEDGVQALESVLGEARATAAPPTISPEATSEASATAVSSTRSASSSNRKEQARPPLDPQCPLRLERLGALFQSSPDFLQDNGCQNQGAVAVEDFGGGVSLSGRVVVACPVAEATALWLRNVVQTEALETFGTRVVGLSNVNGYSCRMRSGGYISEHGFANAIDIGTFHFEDGRRVNIEGGWRPDGTAMGDLTADWFARINEGACDYFQLVLNPNSDAAHRDHFHFDLGPWKSCD